jgi:hypothetical protein
LWGIEWAGDGGLAGEADNGALRLDFDRRSVLARPAGYEDVNDAERRCRDLAMRWVVGDRATTGSAASASQMGRFETKWLSRPENLAALTESSGQWVDKVQQRRPPRIVVLYMDSSASPTYGKQRSTMSQAPFLQNR